MPKDHRGAKILDILAKSRLRQKGDIKCQFWIKLLLLTKQAYNAFSHLPCVVIETVGHKKIEADSGRLKCQK